MSVGYKMERTCEELGGECSLKEMARDDILGGVPMTAIAGQPHTLTIEAEYITRAQMLSVQYWTLAE